VGPRAGLDTVILFLIDLKLHHPYEFLLQHVMVVLDVKGPVLNYKNCQLYLP
jgi:hypothetical protein